MADTYLVKEKLDKLEKWQYLATMLNVAAIQLNTHCSVGCPDCGHKVPFKKGGGDALDWDYYTELVDQFRDIWKQNAVYLAMNSDPYDYSSKGRTFRDAYDYLGDVDCLLTTGVPLGKEEEVFKSLDMIAEKGIPITDFNRNRLKPFMDRVHRECPEYDNRFYQAKRIKFDPDNLPARGLGSFHGVVLTPNEVYSVRVVEPSKEHLVGLVWTPVRPDNFEVPALCRDIYPEQDGTNPSPETIADITTAFLYEGYYPIRKKEDLLLDDGLHIFMAFRYQFWAALSNEDPAKNIENAKELAGVLGKVYERTEKIPERRDRPLNDFEKELMKEFAFFLKIAREMAEGN